MVLLVVSGGWYLLRGTPGMGMGDVKMLAMIGAFLGWHGVLVTLLLGGLMASAFAVAGWISGRLTARSPLPFGSFLAIAAVMTLFWGQWAMAAYRSWAPVIDPGFR